jgi:uncharacterized surface protein with fasciclin (FAS1) repeats
MYSKMIMAFGVAVALAASASTVAAQEMAKDHDMDAKNIVEVAAEAGTFNTLIAAAKAADLADALMGEGPLTVFAPTDEAFAKLPEGTVEMLLKPENKDKLQAVLLYHVVEGKVMSEQVVTLTSAKTLQGDTVDISVKMGKVYVDDAQVIAADVEASNGVIHVIDAVIMPATD